MSTLFNRISFWAQRQPEQVAFIDPRNNMTITYGDLGGLIEESRQFLSQAGFTAIDRIAVLGSGETVMFASALISIARYCTVIPLPDSLSAEELSKKLSLMNAKALFLLDTHNGLLPQLTIPIIHLAVTRDVKAEVHWVFSVGSFQNISPIDENFSAQPDDRTLLVLTSSGTTGVPKVIPLSLRQVSFSMMQTAATLHLTTDDRCLNVMPLYHGHSLIGCMLSTLFSGGTLICTPRKAMNRLPRWIESYKPTWSSMAPSMLAMFLKIWQREHRTSHTFRFLRTASESLSNTLKQHAEAMFGVTVVNAWGMTEAAHQITQTLPWDERAQSVGVSSPLVQIAVLSETGQVLTHGEGELLIKGVTVITAYEHSDSAASFHDGWLRTGDLGHIDEHGGVSLTGRIKEMINRAGEKISPLEIETIAQHYPGVIESVAIPVPNPLHGEEVALIVVLEQSIPQLSLMEFRSFLLRRGLSSNKLPRQIHLVNMIPRTANGKVSRTACAALFAQQQEAMYL